MLGRRLGRAGACIVALVLTACDTALVNWAPFSVQTSPAEVNQVLAAGEPLRITFSDPVVATVAQSLFRVASVEGTVSGDFAWSENTLSFTPVPALAVGKRYTLGFNGQVTLQDGRKFTVNREVPFFSVSAAPPVHVASFSPADGASVNVATPLVVTFDAPIDAQTFQTGFSITPSVATTKLWSADQKTVTLTPSTAWPTGTLVTWQATTALRSASGLPLVGSVSHTFLTNADQQSPQVVGVVPALLVVSTWSPAGADLNALQKGDSLLVTTSEAIKLATLATAFHLTPSIKGHFLAQSDTESVYVLDEPFTVGTTYSLQIGTDLQDTVGNALTVPWLTSFTPAPGYLKVDQIDLTGSATTTFTAFNTVNAFPVCGPSGAAPNLQLALRLVFSDAFAVADRAQFASLTFCQALFPTTGVTALTAPTLVTVAFENSQTVVLTYQGFSVNATAGAPYYYQVKIPGGTSGVKNSRGQTLKGDVWLNFATGP